MTKNNKYFALYACCIPVKGFKRSLICDLQRSNIVYLSNEHLNIINFLRKNPIDKLESKLSAETFKLAMHFLNNLIENELGFFTLNPDNFPRLDTHWQSPSSITNSVLDFSSTPTLYHNQIISQAIQMDCKAIQFRFFYTPSYDDLSFLLKMTTESCVYSISIITPYSNSILDAKDIKNIIDNNLRITEFIVYGAPNNMVQFYRQFHITYTQDKIDNIRYCGKISSNIFNLNLPTFTEAHHHNSCLNRKISIDANGNIKNCPSMAQSFGNIKDTTLQEALDHPEFKKYWNITKDQIAVCKDCEFRYICTDCRAYLENPQDMYAKPLKCGYNPYTCEWEEWSTNPLKQQAIDFYGMREVLPEFKLKPDYVPPRSNRPSPDSAQ